MTARTLLTLAFLGVALVTFAQPGDVDSHEHLQFRRIDNRDGLSHNSVFWILQDRTGFIWLATEDGLNRFDGLEFVVFRNVDDDANSLWDNGVTALAEDRDGWLWIGTRRGLNRYDPSTGAFIRHDAGRPIYVMSLAADSTSGVWLNADGEQLYRASSGSTELKPVSMPELTGRLARVHVDGDGTVRVPVITEIDSTRSSVSIQSHDPVASSWSSTEVAERLPSAASRLFAAQMAGSSPDLFAGFPVGRESGYRGVPSEIGLASAMVVKSGNVVTGLESGLAIWDPSTGSVTRQPVDDDPDAWLSNNVTSIRFDRAGSLWASTLSGLFVHAPNAVRFDHFLPQQPDPGTRASTVVMSIHEDANGVLWTGTAGDGLFRNGQSVLENELVWAILEDRDDNLWIGLHDDLCRFNRQTQTCARLGIPAHVLAQDPSGSVWTAGLGELHRVSPDGVLIQIGETEPAEAFSTNILAIDQRERLCLGARDLRCFDDLGKESASPSLILDEDRVDALVWAIHHDVDGIYWIGTRRGLLRYDPTLDELERFYDGRHFPGSVVYSILEDQQSRLWLGTSNGLVSLDKASRTFRLYDDEDGVLNVEFNRRAASAGSSGRFYFGGLDGVTSFVPSEIGQDPTPPPIAITRVEVSDDEGTRQVPVGRDLHFTADPSTFAFSVEYAALNFVSPSKSRFRYRLEGFEEIWTEAGTRRRAEYTNLDPGSYVFHVIGSNEDGVWNEDGVRLDIIVEPAWWEMWWFRIGVILLLVALGTLAYRYRVAQLLRMERMRLRIARDLHDDIGSRLSGLALMSDMVGSADNLTQQQSGSLDRISRGTREIVDSLRDIVWFVHPDNEEPGELLEKMRVTAGQLLNGCEWDFAPVDTALLDRLDLGQRRHLFLVYKEALNNAARHSGASTVRIHLAKNSDGMEMSVSDDGRGFDVQSAGSGYGLRNMRRRAELLGGSLRVVSSSDRGTEVTLEIPST